VGKVNMEGGVKKKWGGLRKAKEDREGKIKKKWKENQGNCKPGR